MMERDHKEKRQEERGYMNNSKQDEEESLGTVTPNPGFAKLLFLPRLSANSTKVETSLKLKSVILAPLWKEKN